MSPISRRTMIRRGLVATAAHGVNRGERFVVTVDGRESEAKVVGVDPCEDLAVLRVLPGMTVVVPADADAAEAFVEQSLGLAGPLQRTNRSNRGGQERRRCQVAADFLQHQPGLDLAKARAALRFRDEDSSETKLRELLPQAMAEPIFAAGVPPVPELRTDRAFLGHEGGHGIGEHPLVVGQGHHAPGNLKICLATIPSWMLFSKLSPFL